MRTKLLPTYAILILLLINILPKEVWAQNEPFNCDYNAYLFQRNDIYALDLASGSSYLVKEDVTPGSINAVGYNPADGYIWGYLSSPSKSIVKIGKNFNVEIFTIDELTTAGKYIGDVSASGIYYLKGGGTEYYTIDLNPESENYTKYISKGTLSKNISVHDWAFNAVDGQLYTVEKNTNHLYRINPETNVVTDLGLVPILAGLKYTYGAVYFDLSGRFYVSANQTGTVYVIQNVQDLQIGSVLDSNLFAYGPSSSSNDGARCPTAPVPQEDCSNGLDDDGDGLVDCDDPACSGVAACPVLVPKLSSGNEGGLESNDRLSQKVNQRNYLRSKNNYKFDKLKAKKIQKSKNYKKTASKSESFQLSDLVPMDVIEGAQAIESSPSDLIDITNATELISVDYVKNNETVAVVLATKTENGVYEHTKFICDRLLGAEILSVSTIEIKEQPFIKSIIKNRDGTKEFVLSFSGKLKNNDANFGIESHWNIDKYEAGATFYNFQIWTNTIDDLFTLGEETLELFDIQKPILDFNNSTPPPVFVKKGIYKNGALELELINVSRSKTIVIDAGFKRTETSETEYFNETIELETGYITNLKIETGNIFDIGFRIENDSNRTPDDVFMSDGVWGKDDSPEGTTVTNFEITQNENLYAGTGYKVERDIALKATTNSYVSAYRSFTPTFKTVDLSEYNALEFSATGNSDVEITIVKEGIDQWENQFKKTVKLTEEKNDFVISLDHFKSLTVNNFDLSDVVSIVFTMSSDGVTTVEKELAIKDLVFIQKTLSVDNNVVEEGETVLYPNPMKLSTELSFYSEVEARSKLEVYNITGALLKRTYFDTKFGNNKISLEKGKLSAGLYFVKISNNNKTYKTKKLIIE
ncbi:T9SS type A sorting domain-containing protein [Polaribacter sp. KT 15]|uniref:T9SS type A sorting domain-containing protein n=1 Tax=Polaribacter sp. KT 15 TaxID=1896175 RepID=UPI00090C5483|nr:T9SS type A sorting domain-containing protein [Polaribacter sp. KT 15]SHM81353.1 Por secretion system C-terminal sorting domain-containing protein [Polaribacter sp. KT 15]